MTDDLTYSAYPESDPMEGARLADAVRVLRKQAGRDGLVMMTWTYPDGEYQSLTVAGPEHRAEGDEDEDEDR